MVVGMNFALAAPEIFLGIMIVVVLLADLFVPKRDHFLAHWLTVATMVIGFVLTLPLLHHGAGTKVAYTFSQLFVLDHFSVVVKLAMWVIAFAVVIYSRTYFKTRAIFQGEFYLLMLSSLLGGFVLVSANALVTLYLGLELLSLPLYAMIAMRRDSKRGPEAAMKYFVMGSAASGLLLFGMTLVYAITKSIYLPTIFSQIVHMGIYNLIPLSFAFILMIAAIVFKLSGAPLHMWAPDVYEGAPLPVTSFLSTVPKLAVLMMFVHLVLQNVAIPGHESMSLHLVLIVAVLSVFVGNVVAVVQRNIKRLLAYSTVSHIGFILLALAMGVVGEQAAVFYTLVYALMSVAAFGALILLGQKGWDVDQVSDLQGLSKRNGFIAFILLLTMLSMVGIPPFIGFIAKLKVIMLLIAQQHIGLAVFALIMSVVGAYYYLRVIKVMYFESPKDGIPTSELKVGGCACDGNIILAINGLGLLVLGLFPTLLMGFVS